MLDVLEVSSVPGSDVSSRSNDMAVTFCYLRWGDVVCLVAWVCAMTDSSVPAKFQAVPRCERFTPDPELLHSVGVNSPKGVAGA